MQHYVAMEHLKRAHTYSRILSMILSTILVILSSFFHKHVGKLGLIGTVASLLVFLGGGIGLVSVRGRRTSCAFCVPVDAFAAVLLSSGAITFATVLALFPCRKPIKCAVFRGTTAVMFLTMINVVFAMSSLIILWKNRMQFIRAPRQVVERPVPMTERRDGTQDKEPDLTVSQRAR